MRHQWRVDFKKVIEKRLRKGVDRVTHSAEVIVYATDSAEAISIASKQGGAATPGNLCCVTRML